ncbi:MAG TPA: type VI secretion system baseplate subunit TssF [Ramlibacter sp.]|uniref:type VI secretion system baseplate subunit TssF n=1 Tax=Ramlibacter sp. TaxID=1917967 RepID=UPI002B6F31ED|nr:type VI secretion system baseplate subunit TssF [Ramlibacter sp.]HVZ43829.1 type VI secretion system baseplate subunit TssF [Ramlibacter sp.]
MAEAIHNDLLEYYKRELTYLRTQGTHFAGRYPKVAARLALQGSESLDPHTERLVESVAFLAARVHRDLDREFPQVASALLDNLCPTLTQPVPSMTIAEFGLDPTQGKVTSGLKIPRHTIVYAATPEGNQCRFRTAWETVLWPITLAHASLGGDATVRLVLECASDTDFSELETDALRFHVHGDWMAAMPAYELLASAVTQVSVMPEGEHARMLPPGSWRELGYAEGEEVIAAPAHTQPAYVLLQEYFAFPRKFHFFELANLRGRLGSGRRCEVILQLDRAPRAVRGLNADNLRLGCTPLVNLFPRTSEPILVDHRHYEYLLAADRQRGASTEVHSVLQVMASDPAAERPVIVPNFAGLGHVESDEQTTFWSMRREQSLRPDITGTDVFIAFVDRANALKTPSEPVIYANLLCTNRRLAEQVPLGARMVMEGASQSTHVRCLYEPTPQTDPPLGSETLWRLVSLLTLNHQSLVEGSAGREQLQEMLRLFASDSRRDHEQIRGIRELSARSVTARIGADAWRGYSRGTEVTLEFEEDAFVGGSPLLLAAVLARFFAMYTSINSFVRLAVRRGDEVWKQWEAMSGRQPIL